MSAIVRGGLFSTAGTKSAAKCYIGFGGATTHVCLPCATAGHRTRTQATLDGAFALVVDLTAVFCLGRTTHRQTVAAGGVVTTVALFASRHTAPLSTAIGVGSTALQAARCANRVSWFASMVASAARTIAITKARTAGNFRTPHGTAIGSKLAGLNRSATATLSTHSITLVGARFGHAASLSRADHARITVVELLAAHLAIGVGDAAIAIAAILGIVVLDRAYPEILPAKARPFVGATKVSTLLPLLLCRPATIDPVQVAIGTTRISMITATTLVGNRGTACGGCVAASTIHRVSACIIDAATLDLLLLTIGWFTWGITTICAADLRACARAAFKFSAAPIQKPSALGAEFLAGLGYAGCLSHAAMVFGIAGGRPNVSRIALAFTGFIECRMQPLGPTQQVRLLGGRTAKGS